jgi:alanyl-tRNA synthetase
MFYWTGKTPAPKDFNPSDKQWVEIWNDVFMQYNKTSDGSFEELSQKNVDTGMGLERVTAILQGKDNVYGTELFQSIIEEIKGITEKPYEENEKSFRIIADHLKAATFILAEKLVPFKDGRGYVLRKLIRRAIKYAWVLDINTTQFVPSLVPVVIDIYKDIYTELEDNKDFVINEMAKEINDFSNKYEESFKNSVKEYSRNLELFSAEKTEPFSYKQMFPRIKEISGKEIFKKYQERGGVEPEFIRMKVEENMAEEERKVNEHEWKKITDEFNEALLNHQNLSRTASAGQFKSGLADNSEQTTKYHTATHLLLAALREVLGDEVVQKGSNITAERIRFDFSFNRKVAAEEIKKVEDLVNEKIRASLPVVCEEMETEQAKERGAMGVFGHKYGDRVKVYSIGQGENICSQEICAGPHVQNTKELGEFKIIKEEASSAGIRRVKATLS